MVGKTTRKTAPTPFSRPSIDLGRHGKRWQEVRVSKIERGDIVPGLGLVAGGELRSQTGGLKPLFQVRIVNAAGAALHWTWNGHEMEPRTKVFR